MRTLPRAMALHVLPYAAMAAFALGAGAGCVVHAHDDGYAQVDLVDAYGYHHHGYYDDGHHWHGGWYDNDHNYHDDPDDWHR